MLAVMIVPTGIEAEIGGHSGDATSAAHLLAECCDNLILHPNVVNASDFTEQPANSLYVEGSMLDDFLDGSVQLQLVRQNHILVVANTAGVETVTAVNAMRSLLGISAEIVTLPTPLTMRGFLDDKKGRATGDITGVEELINEVDKHCYDVLAVHTPVAVDPQVAEQYVNHGGLNPWGGVEAKLSKEIYWRTGKPVAHAPIEAHADYKVAEGADPRLAPELLCSAHLGCVLRGLHKAPRPVRDGGISVLDVDVLISPMCWGTPHKICRERGLPIIFVKGNPTRRLVDWHDNFVSSDGYIVHNYVEAAGLMTLMRMGRSLESVTRPITQVKVNGC